MPLPSSPSLPHPHAYRNRRPGTLLASWHRHPPLGCTTSRFSLQKWRRLRGVGQLEDRRWDVIHWNFDLHDLEYMGPNGENLADPADASSHPQVAIKAYAGNIKAFRLSGSRSSRRW